MIDKENLIDELDLIKCRLRDRIDDIKDREKELGLCQRKLVEIR
jgi:hypothetical protein